VRAEDSHDDGFIFEAQFGGGGFDRVEGRP
jgi:hypothetical protein